MDKFNKIDMREEYKNSESFEVAVAALGSKFHEDWRKTRLNKDGGFEPRIKQTADSFWIAQNGTDKVDIANTSYEDLPEDWKGENKAAAEVIVGIIERYDGIPDIGNVDIRSDVGGVIHEAWLQRNSEWAPDEQKLPFDELSIEDQEKDLDQIRVAREIFGN